MCGIAGFVVSDANVTVEGRGALLDRMCAVIRHRGPDDQGTMVAGRAALGMRRLSIIDVAGGHQPIYNETGRVAIVFNGEIYNFQEVTEELKARGHVFKTHSDTEAIVHAYEEYGLDCVQHLRGMFGLAIWDADAEKLFLARDRVGKKPLYYTLTRGGELVFGSELKSLLEHPGVGREVDPQAVDAYLSFGYVPDPYSIFRGVKKLPPGHLLTFEKGEVAVREYWDFQFETGEEKPEAYYLENVRELLDESVRLRMISEVPLGAFLSGGVDSSTIVGLMARHSPFPVKTFSIGFAEDSYNELKYARIAAKHFATEHHEFIVTPEICDVVDELAWHFDEPFADSSAIPTYMVSKLAREHVTVVLSGDGGDELFGGYTRYAIDQQRAKLGRLPRGVREGVLRPLSENLPHGAWGRNYLRNVSLDPIDRYIDSISQFTELHKRSLYTDGFRRGLNAAGGAIGTELFRSFANSIDTGNALDPLLYLDSKTYLPGDILTKVDRMSMAVSLEARAPLLDHKLIDFVSRIPASMKLRGNTTKYLLKEAVRDLVPAEVLDRPKQGFGVPVQEWINRQLRSRIRETLTERRAVERGIVRPEYVQVLLDEHERGRRDHSAPLWSLLMLELWYRTFVDAQPSTQTESARESVAAADLAGVA
jgi:asparagine synthase (glutamine-hydrolysing)